jgi:hypothetical protein
MPGFIPAQSLHSEIDQTLRTITRVIARQFPPHRAAETSVLDVVDFLARDLWVVVRDHGAGCRVIRPGCNCLWVVEDLGVGLGEGLGGVSFCGWWVCQWNGCVRRGVVQIRSS